MSNTLSKRTAHGAAAAGGATVTYEAPATDELRPAPQGAAEPVKRRSDGTVDPDGARQLARLRWEAAATPDFAARELDRLPAPDFAPFDKARREYLSQRRKELHELTGGVSASVGATLRGEAWLTALGEYYATVATTSLDHESADRAHRFLSKASIERAKAWDLAVVEAKSRTDRDHDKPPSWFVAEPAPPKTTTSTPDSATASEAPSGPEETPSDD